MSCWNLSAYPRNALSRVIMAWEGEGRVCAAVGTGGTCWCRGGGGGARRAWPCCLTGVIDSMYACAATRVLEARRNAKASIWDSMALSIVGCDPDGSMARALMGVTPSAWKKVTIRGGGCNARVGPTARPLGFIGRLILRQTIDR